jgi:DNA-binding NarL/FixJ family response regulator
MRVVIAEDQVLLREGLGRLFADAGHEVVASYGDAEQVLGEVAAHAPDLVVIDGRMPPTFTDEGTRTARELKDAHPDVGVLVLSQHIETVHAVSLVALGGFGYLLKDRVLEVGDFLDGRAGGAGRIGARSAGRGSTRLALRRAEPLSQLSARERGARAGGSGAHEHRDRKTPLSERANRRGARAARADEARPPGR